MLRLSFISISKVGFFSEKLLHFVKSLLNDHAAIVGEEITSSPLCADTFEIYQ